jgi:FkbM family methyltransferase
MCCIIIISIFTAYTQLVKNAPCFQYRSNFEYEPPPLSNTHRIIDAVSATSFSIDSQTGKILLPHNTTTVVFDIGARGSDYLSVMEINDDPSVALILVDPLPDSSIPLMKRVAEYSMRGYAGGEAFLDQDMSKQIYLLRAAVGREEGIANLNVAMAPACTSILNTSAKNDFWCADHHSSIKMVKVPVITLGDLLELLPLDDLKNVHVKVDTEGADLAVLQGAGNMLQSVDTVIIECSNEATNRTFRDDECTTQRALKYMSEKGFNTSSVKGQGDLVNIFFARDDYRGPLPDYLLHGGLALHEFYQEFHSS